MSILNYSETTNVRKVESQTCLSGNFVCMISLQHKSKPNCVPILFTCFGWCADYQWSEKNICDDIRNISQDILTHMELRQPFSGSSPFVLKHRKIASEPGAPPALCAGSRLAPAMRVISRAAVKGYGGAYFSR